MASKTRKRQKPQEPVTELDDSFNRVMNRACLAAADYAGPERVFNVGDGSHASMTVYFQAVAEAAGLPPPEERPMAEVVALASPAMRGFLTESRRVLTGRMTDLLGFRPRYADFREGIAASLAEQGPGSSQ